MNNIKGHVNIYKDRNRDRRKLIIKSDWIDSSKRYSFKKEENFLIVTKHYLEIPRTAKKTKIGQFAVPSSFPLGKFEIDEEDSTEDELIIYFN